MSVYLKALVQTPSILRAVPVVQAGRLGVQAGRQASRLTLAHSGSPGWLRGRATRRFQDLVVRLQYKSLSPTMHKLAVPTLAGSRNLADPK